MPVRNPAETVKPRKAAARRDPILISTLAHVSFVTFVLIGPFSIAIPLIIWLLERNRPKPMVSIEFHARQAFFYQLAVYLIAAVLGGIAALMVIILIGLLLIPFIILAFLAAVGYAVYGGVQVWNGRRFRYRYLTNFIESSGGKFLGSTTAKRPSSKGIPRKPAGKTKPQKAGSSRRT